MTAVRTINDRQLHYQMRSDGDNTVQGLYVIGADGTAYGWLNDYDQRDVKEFLALGLEAFHTMPPHPVTIAQAQLDEVWSQRPPQGGATVRVFCRIPSPPAGANVINQGVGTDHLWIYPSDISALLDLARAHAPDSANGSEYPLPQNLVARLVRFHLVDNVRGEPDMWKPEEIKEAQFNAVTLSNSPTIISFKGKFSQATKSNKRGLTGELVGIISIDASTRKLLEFSTYGEGTAWGRSTFTPNQPQGKFGIVFAMKEVDDDVAKEVAPEAVSYDYERPRLQIAGAH